MASRVHLGFILVPTHGRGFGSDLCGLLDPLAFANSTFLEASYIARAGLFGVSLVPEKSILLEMSK